VLLSELVVAWMKEQGYAVVAWADAKPLVYRHRTVIQPNSILPYAIARVYEDHVRLFNVNDLSNTGGTSLPFSYFVPDGNFPFHYAYPYEPGFFKKISNLLRLCDVHLFSNDALSYDIYLHYVPVNV
jgi:hypothetical protein